MTFNLTSRFSEGGRRGRAGRWGDGKETLHVNITANASHLSTNKNIAEVNGAFLWHTLAGPMTLTTYEIQAPGGLSFESSRVVPTAEENRPTNVALPVALYLGLPA